MEGRIHINFPIHGEDREGGMNIQGCEVQAQEIGAVNDAVQQVQSGAPAFGIGAVNDENMPVQAGAPAFGIGAGNEEWPALPSAPGFAIGARNDRVRPEEADEPRFDVPENMEGRLRYSDVVRGAHINLPIHGEDRESGMNIEGGEVEAQEIGAVNDGGQQVQCRAPAFGIGAGSDEHMPVQEGAPGFGIDALNGEKCSALAAAPGFAIGAGNDGVRPEEADQPRFDVPEILERMCESVESDKLAVEQEGEDEDNENGGRQVQSRAPAYGIDAGNDEQMPVQARAPGFGMGALNYEEWPALVAAPGFAIGAGNDGVRPEEADEPRFGVPENMEGQLRYSDVVRRIHINFPIRREDRQSGMNIQDGQVEAKEIGAVNDGGQQMQSGAPAFGVGAGNDEQMPVQDGAPGFGTGALNYEEWPALVAAPGFAIGAGNGGVRPEEADEPRFGVPENMEGQLRYSDVVRGTHINFPIRGEDRQRGMNIQGGQVEAKEIGAVNDGGQQIQSGAPEFGVGAGNDEQMPEQDGAPGFGTGELNYEEWPAPAAAHGFAIGAGNDGVWPEEADEPRFDVPEILERVCESVESFWDVELEIEEACAICLEALNHVEDDHNENDNVKGNLRWLPCSHLFHSHCISELFHRNTRCPICDRVP